VGGGEGIREWGAGWAGPRVEAGVGRSGGLVASWASRPSGGFVFFCFVISFLLFLSFSIIFNLGHLGNL